MRQHLMERRESSRLDFLRNVTGGTWVIDLTAPDKVIVLCWAADAMLLIELEP